MKPLIILLVEDDRNDSNDLRALLEKAGAAELAGAQYGKLRIELAENQIEANQAVAAMQYDIVLLDLQYPFSLEPLSMEEPVVLRGMQWLPTLRQLQPKAAIVVLTKHAEVPTVVTAIRDHHANDFVAKTENFENILARIQTAWKNAHDLQQAVTLRNEYRALLRTLGSHAFAEDAGGLISRTKARLTRIAQEIESGDSSVIDDAPRRIRDAVKRLSNEFAKVTRLLGNLRQPMSEVDLVKDLLEPLEALYEGPIHISQVPAQPIRVWTFPDDLRVAIYEVAQNAVDTGASAITIGVEQLGKDAVIHVTDNGGGFSPEAMARGFEPCFSTRKDQGNRHQGLGLYIARRMMHSIGGEIRVESKATGAGVSLSVTNLGKS
jgi:signal transduction histidine kinase